MNFSKANFLTYIIATILFLLNPSVGFTDMVDWNTITLEKAVKEVCNQVDSEIIIKSKIEIDKFNAGIFPSESFNKLLRDLVLSSLKKAFDEFNYHKTDDNIIYVIRNSGFQNGINYCRSFKPEVAKFIYNAVKKTDRKGKVLSGALNLFFLRGGGLIFKELNNFGKKLLLLAGGGVVSIQGFKKYFEYQRQSEGFEIVKAKCGDPKSQSYQSCATQLINSGLDKLESEIVSTSQDFESTDSVISSLVLVQIQELEKNLTNTDDQEKKYQLSRKLEERKLFLAQLQREKF